MNGLRRRPSAAPGETPLARGPENLRRLLRYLKPYRGRLAFALLALVVSSLITLGMPVVLTKVVDEVLPQNNISLLNQITAALLALFMIRSLVMLVENFNLNYIGERITFDLRRELYEQIQAMPLAFFEQRRTGELVSRFTNDVTVLRRALTDNLGALLQPFITLTGSVIVMLLLNWQLTLFTLALAPIVLAIGGFYGLRLRRASTQIQDETAGATVIVEEVLQNVRVVKSFVRERHEKERFMTAVTRALQAAVKMLWLRALFTPTVSFFTLGSLALILWFGGQQVLEGRLTSGELAAFLVYGLTVAGSIRTLIGLYSHVEETLGAMRRVFEVLDEQPTLQDKPDARALTQVQGRITFDNVRFSYDGATEVLHSISLDIAPGEIIALVGPSGAGKTTLFNLIPRFYDPTSGAVRLDDADVRDLQQASLREHIGIVPQETLLFGGTILENIQYGRLDATRAEMMAAALAANAHGFIEALPDGYDTLVGDRGVRLSNGQRQRVAIARALLKDPRILLLDEATSALDSESEQLVQEALSRLMQGRTTVIIAHRLSTIRVAHRIAILNHGTLLELGTHDELLANKGLYTRLHELQFREDVLETVAADSLTPLEIGPD